MGDRGHIGYLDGWRGGSIFLLLFGHLNLTPIIHGKEFNPQGLAVECFFVLSGRLMADILFVRESPLAKFYVHRVSRIIPALWVFAFAMLALSPYVARLHVTWIDVFNVITFTSNYRQTTGTFGHV
jgi:peptidoglycan/LPS O-acetylase OafA/YrhL